MNSIYVDYVSSMARSSTAFEIAEPNHRHIFDMYEEYICNPNLWHKVIILNNRQHRNSILSSILKHVHPFDCIPVCYYKSDETTFFFLRNCPHAIDKLCNELTVPNLLHSRRPFKLKIVLGYCTKSSPTVKAENNILKVLEKRYNPETKHLGLDKFHHDYGLTEFCILSQSQILNYVLLLSRKFEVHHLSLKKNNIFSLSRVAEFSNMRSLKSLDLRENSIEDLSELIILQHLQISSLLLENNPLCLLYDNIDYASAIHQKFPFLKFLDGIHLSEFVAKTSNFLCNIRGHSLVDQFLEHYFTLFDGRRKAIAVLYEENSVFSFSSAYSTNEFMYNTFMHPFFVDLRTAQKFVAVGTNNISEVLNRFRPSRHDPYNFTVDLMYYSDETAVLTVTGRLRQLGQKCPGGPIILHFARTFVLVKKVYNEYKILNDIWVITNPSDKETDKPFECARKPNGKVFKFGKSIKTPNLIATQKRDKDYMVNAFGKIATVNLCWSRRLLEQHKYNLQDTLQYFVDMYEDDKIPEAAFIPDAEVSRENEVSVNTTPPSVEKCKFNV